MSDVASFLKVADSTIRNWTNPGDPSYRADFPVHRLKNNNRYFLASEIKEFLDGEERRGFPDPRLS